MGQVSCLIYVPDSLWYSLIMGMATSEPLSASGESLGWHAGSACHCSATWPVSSRYQPGDTATVTVKVVAANAVRVFFKPSSRKTQADTYIPPVRKWVLAEDVKKHKTVPSPRDDVQPCFYSYLLTTFTATMSVSKILSDLLTSR